jgi:hypothetical protein
MSLTHRAVQIGNALSQLLNACLPGGWSDESTSSRSWRMSSRHKGWAAMRWLIDTVFAAFGDHDHCFDAWMSELLMKQWPPEVRDAVMAREQQA